MKKERVNHKDTKGTKLMTCSIFLDNLFHPCGSVFIRG